MRRKHRKLVQTADLDITAFMNLMIVLVPVLLLSSVFAHNAVLDLNFPLSNDDPIDLPEKELQLQVILREGAIAIADDEAGLIKRIEVVDETERFVQLRESLQDIKRQLPEKTAIAILAEQGIDYQTIVTTMDTVRSYPTVVAANLVEAELFPDISIGDAPKLGDSP